MLTDEQIEEIWDNHLVKVFGKTGFSVIGFARAIEAACSICTRSDGKSVVFKRLEEVSEERAPEPTGTTMGATTMKNTQKNLL